MISKVSKFESHLREIKKPLLCCNYIGGAYISSDFHQWILLKRGPPCLQWARVTPPQPSEWNWSSVPVLPRGLWSLERQHMDVLCLSELHNGLYSEPKSGFPRPSLWKTRSGIYLPLQPYWSPERQHMDMHFLSRLLKSLWKLRAVLPRKKVAEKLWICFSMKFSVSRESKNGSPADIKTPPVQTF